MFRTAPMSPCGVVYVAGHTALWTLSLSHYKNIVNVTNLAFLYSNFHHIIINFNDAIKFNFE